MAIVLMTQQSCDIISWVETTF